MRQAISLWRAIQTWQWREDSLPEPSGASAVDSSLDYSFAAIDHLRRGLDREEAWWDAYFADAGIVPLTILTRTSQAA